MRKSTAPAISTASLGLGRLGGWSTGSNFSSAAHSPSAAPSSSLVLRLGFRSPGDLRGGRRAAPPGQRSQVAVTRRPEVDTPRARLVCLVRHKEPP